MRYLIFSLIIAVSGCVSAKPVDNLDDPHRWVDQQLRFGISRVQDLDHIDNAEWATSSITEPLPPNKARALEEIHKIFTNIGLSLTPTTSPISRRWHSPPPCGIVDFRSFVGNYSKWLAENPNPGHVSTAWFSDIFQYSALLNNWACIGGGGRLVADIRLMLPLAAITPHLVVLRGELGDCVSDPNTVYKLPDNCSLAKIACKDGFWKKCPNTCAEVDIQCSTDSPITCPDGICTPVERESGSCLADCPPVVTLPDCADAIIDMEKALATVKDRCTQ